LVNSYHPFSQREGRLRNRGIPVPALSLRLVKLRSYNLTTRRLLSNNSFYNAVPGLEANAPTDIVAALKLT
jgi:hypothetical protein